MRVSNLESKIFSLKQFPDKEWQEMVEAKLVDMEKKSVTVNYNSRNTFYILINFLKIKIMGIKTSAIYTVAGFVAVMLSGTVLVSAANNSRPGDPLYGLDLAIENIQRTFTADPQAKNSLELQILQERMDELRSLQTDNSEHIDDSVSEVEHQLDDTENELEDSNTDNSSKENDTNIIEDYRHEVENIKSTPHPTEVENHNNETQKTPEPTEKPEVHPTEENHND